MEINFDNFRKQTVDYFNDVVEIINKADTQKNKLTINDIDSLSDSLKGLRQRIVILTCLEDENQNIKCINAKVESIKI